MPDLRKLNVYQLLASRQTAQASAATVPAMRFVQTGGTIGVPRNEGSQAYSDGGKYLTAVDWIDSIQGAGAPEIMATPDEVAWILHAFTGTDTTLAVTGPPAKVKHTFTPGTGPGYWTTWWTWVGETANALRLRHVDARIGQVVITAGTGSKPLRVTPSLIVADPGWYVTSAAWPASPPPMPTDTPFLWTDGVGRYSVDGNVFEGATQFTLTLNEDLQPVWGDNERMHTVYSNNPTVSIAATLLLDNETQSKWNTMMYGTSSPTAGTKPLAGVPALGSFSCGLFARDSAGAVNGDKFEVSVPGVHWAAPEHPGPNPGGGTAELNLAGAGRISGSSAMFTIDVTTDAAAFTA